MQSVLLAGAEPRRMLGPRALHRVQNVDGALTTVDIPLLLACPRGPKLFLTQANGG